MTFVGLNTNVFSSSSNPIEYGNGEHPPICLSHLVAIVGSYGEVFSLLAFRRWTKVAMEGV